MERKKAEEEKLKDQQFEEWLYFGETNGKNVINFHITNESFQNAYFIGHQVDLDESNELEKNTEAANQCMNIKQKISIHVNYILFIFQQLRILQQFQILMKSK